MKGFVDYFEIYDSNFNKVPLPVDDLEYGLLGLDIYVSSIGQDVTEHASNGMPGTLITGVQDRNRSITLSAMIKAMNSTDYRLKRDRVYSFFRELGSFYVTETQQGNKLMKVRVVEQYSAIRPQNFRTIADVEIPLKIDGQPYWISRFKTMDLHNNKGIPVTGNWSFGMGLDVDPSKLKYQFSNVSQFEFYNAGKQLKTIQEKGNCEIKIEFNQEVTSFTIEDATGGKWEYNPSKNTDWKIKAGSTLIFNGHDVRLNGKTIMERTNRYYFVIEKLMNKWKITGLSNYKITLDFRFKYY